VHGFLATLVPEPSSAAIVIASVVCSLPDEASNTPQSEPPPNLPASKPPKQNLVVSAERREQLLERLAQEATNAELAAEFGLSSRQVQGFRMGPAREIAARRGRLPKTEIGLPQFGSGTPRAIQ
jgi:hypothetical protein